MITADSLVAQVWSHFDKALYEDDPRSLEKLAFNVETLFSKSGMVVIGRYQEVAMAKHLLTSVSSLLTELVVRMDANSPTADIVASDVNAALVPLKGYAERIEIHTFPQRTPFLDKNPLSEEAP